MKGKWHRPSDSLFIYLSEDLKSTPHIAGFDLDWTLVRPYQKYFPVSADDMTILPNRIEKLKDLQSRGYTIVIFTNQKSKGKQIDLRFKRVNHVRTILQDIPFILLMSVSEDGYRKPNVGMYQTLIQMVPNLKTAFYCGDAAGRPQDFSDSDFLFAQNTGMKFYTPEEIFLPIFNMKTNIGLKEVPLPENPVLVLIMGMQGSGKTTYYQQKLEPLGYVHVNQDSLGTRAKTIKYYKTILIQGKNICLDATHPGLEKRNEFYKLARDHNYNIVTIYIVRDGKGFNKLRPEPVPTIAYSMFYKYLEEPTADNTPGELYQLF